MAYCERCGREVSDFEPVCPYCGWSFSSEKRELLREIQECKHYRKRALGIFLVGMFGIWIVSFSTFILLMALIALGFAPAMAVYYTWKKRKAEKKLEDFKK